MAKNKIHAGGALGRLIRFALFVVIALMVAANGFVHMPREWRDAKTAGWPEPVVRTAATLGNAFADYTDALGLSGRDVAVALPVFSSSSGFAFAGEPRAIPGGVAPKDVVTLHKKAFSIGWSPSQRHAVWAAYRVPPIKTPFALARPSTFSADATAPNSPKAAAYTHSGYDRGHLVPNHAIASRFGKEAQVETFLMSNVAPQRPWLNQGPWADVELRIADHWPDRYGDVWVIVGTIHSPDPRPQKLSGGIGIPTAFYQIAITRHKEQLRACAVVMPQRISRRAKPRVYLATIDEIERLSGFDFFWALPDEEEALLEAGRPTRLWPSGFHGLVSIIKRRHGIYK